MDNAILMGAGSDGSSQVKKEGAAFGDLDVGNDDHELSALNNGPIRFPYVRDPPRPETHAAATWDEDDAQVTALELLHEMTDGDMMLFALPSFLPIYAKNRGRGAGGGLRNRVRN